MSKEVFTPSTDKFTIVTWNTLLDYTRTNAGLIRPQEDRAPSQVDTLSQLRQQLGADLDVVAIQESHKSDNRHNGEFLAESLGYGKGYWYKHNAKPYPQSKTGRSNEYMGMFGARVDHAEDIDLGDNRKAVLTHIGKVAIVNIHPRAGVGNEDLQIEQIGVALKVLDEFESAALVGDLNSHLRSKARKMIETEEYVSAFSSTRQRHPKTWPTPNYRSVMYGAAAGHILPSVVLDGIYTRGLIVNDAGSFIGDSDHAGLWAEVEAPR